MNTDDQLNALIRAALIHCQFETIHPFLDGNGCVGRLLITLSLMEKNVLTTPALYISYFLKKNRVEYYDRMTEVRTKGNYKQWIKFFLQALMESAKDAIDTIDKFVILHNKNVNVISKMGRAAKNTMLVFNYLEANPMIEIRKTAKVLGIPLIPLPVLSEGLWIQAFSCRHLVPAETAPLRIKPILVFCAKELEIIPFREEYYFILQLIIETINNLKRIMITLYCRYLAFNIKGSSPFPMSFNHSFLH